MSPAETPGWGSWESHEAEQLARWASLTPAERLDWLEEAKAFQALVEEARDGARARPLEDVRTPEDRRTRHGLPGSR